MHRTIIKTTTIVNGQPMTYIKEVNRINGAIQMTERYEPIELSSQNGNNSGSGNSNNGNIRNNNQLNNHFNSLFDNMFTMNPFRLGNLFNSNSNQNGNNQNSTNNSNNNNSNNNNNNNINTNNTSNMQSSLQNNLFFFLPVMLINLGNNTNNKQKEDYTKKIETLEKEIVKDSDQQCVICLSDFNKEEEAVKTSCNHLYHKECLRTWFKENNSCPTCRKTVD